MRTVIEYSNTFNNIEVKIERIGNEEDEGRYTLKVHVPDPKIGFTGRFRDYREIISSDYLRSLLVGRNSEGLNFSQWVGSLNLQMSPREKVWWETRAKRLQYGKEVRK